MKYLLLLFVLLVAGTPAGAQVPRQPAQPDSLGASLPTPPAAPDTVAALHRLFAARRRQQLYIAGGIVILGAANVVLIGSSAKPYASGGSGYGSLNSGPLLDFTGFEQILAGTLTLVLVATEAIFYKKYNRAHEQQAVEEFQMYHLSWQIKRKLKAKYFHQ